MTRRNATLCLVSEIKTHEALTLSATSKEDLDFTLGFECTSFGIDNCATHHICGERNLFIEPMAIISNVGVKGIAGSLPAEGIGTVSFVIKDDNGKVHSIILHKVIFLPSAAKNLISVSQWSLDRKDDCSITSRGTHSLFTWDNEQYRKTIHHPLDCAIPLMPVNEADTAIAMFTSKHNRRFADTNELLLPNGTNDDDIYRESRAKVLPNPAKDKQSELGTAHTRAASNHVFHEGDVVRVHLNNKSVICVVVSKMRLIDRSHRYVVRQLNS